MKKTILKALQECDGFVSGQQLCDQLGVSRTAVWKAINQLKEDGYEIEAVRNKGYYIKAKPDLVSVEAVGSLLRTTWMGNDIEYYEQTDSTNTRAKFAAERGKKNGTLILAEEQTAGKGRKGRSWVSPKGNSIYMTILIKPDFEPVKAPSITLVMAYSIAKAIRRMTGLDAQIKWPNDVIIGSRKVCGILTEMSAQVDYVDYIVVGVGINVNTKEFPEELRDKATSLALEKGETVNRAELIAEILQEFEQDYEQFVRADDLAFMEEGYNEILVNRGKEVMILAPAGAYPAKAIGINSQGELIIEKTNGTKDVIFSGEVSVRGIYGYV